MVREKNMQLIKALYENGEIECRDKLIENNTRLVYHIANQKFRGSRYFEDLCSSGFIGLIKAVDGFDYKKGVKFATFATRCIENEMFMFLRVEKKHTKNVSTSLDECLINEENKGPVEFIDQYKTGEDFDRELCDKMYVKYVLDAMDKVLTKTECEIVKHSYGLCGERMKQRELSDEYGYSQSYISRILTKSNGKMKKYLLKSAQEEEQNVNI